MNLTCMSRAYQDKSIGISYSVIVALYTRTSDVSVMCNAHAPAPRFLVDEAPPTANESMRLLMTATDISRMQNVDAKTL